MPFSLAREPACSGRGHLTLVAVILATNRVWHFYRTDQPNEMREGGPAERNLHIARAAPVSAPCGGALPKPPRTPDGRDDGPAPVLANGALCVASWVERPLFGLKEFI